MKTPVVLVIASLAAAILLAASFVIATGARGENLSFESTLRPLTDNSAGQIPLMSPAAK